MKNLRKVAIGSLVVTGLLLAGGSFAQAEVQPNAEQTATVNEQQKALQAGYTAEQYQAIMNQPKLASEAVISTLAGNQPKIQTRAASADEQREAVVAEALKQKGKPFVWGGNSPAVGFDSSGLIQYVYRAAVNIELPRSTVLQEQKGEDVSLSALKPGDLLFYGSRGQTYSVTLYIGNGQMIYSPEPGDVVKVTGMQYWKPDFARRIIKDTVAPKPTPDPEPEVQGAVYRIYNPNGGNHHFTLSKEEADNLISLGWRNEGIGWVSPATGDAVYRVYNPNNGRHHYTVSAGEKDSLVKVGWKYEGMGWLSGGTVPVYRVYNPYAPATEDSHHYTTSQAERDSLVKVGWKDEGIGWYAEKAQ